MRGFFITIWVGLDQSSPAAHMHDSHTQTRLVSRAKETELILSQYKNEQHERHMKL